MTKTRRVKGGVSRDVMEALHEAEQKGIEDAKKPIYKSLAAPRGVRINEVARILIRKYPGVSEGQIREKFVEGFTNTRARNPGVQGSSRRKTRKVKRGGVSPAMANALSAAETMGKFDKQLGSPSRAEQIADDLTTQYGVGAITNARTLIRDKYAASYAQASRTPVRSGTGPTGFGTGVPPPPPGPPTLTSTGFGSS